MSESEFDRDFIIEGPEELGSIEFWNQVLDALKDKDKELVERKSVDDLRSAYKALKPKITTDELDLEQCIRVLENYFTVQHVQQNIKKEIVDDEVAVANEENCDQHNLNETTSSDRRLSSRKRKQTEFYVDDKLDINVYNRPLRANMHGKKISNFVTTPKPKKPKPQPERIVQPEVPSTLHQSFRVIGKREEDPTDPAGILRREAIVDALIEVRYREYQKLGGNNPIRKQMYEQAIRELRNHGYFASQKELVNTLAILRNNTHRKLRKVNDDKSQLTRLQKKVLYCIGESDELPDAAERTLPRQNINVSLPNLSFRHSNAPSTSRQSAQSSFIRNQQMNVSHLSNLTGGISDEDYLDQLHLEEVEAKLEHMEAKRRFLMLQKEIIVNRRRQRRQNH